MLPCSSEYSSRVALDFELGSWIYYLLIYVVRDVSKYFNTSKSQFPHL